MTSAADPIVLVHGYWHGSWCWSEVIAQLAGMGRPAVAVDLAGHGLFARRPRSVSARPFDATALATEPSPVAGVDLDQAGEQLVAQIRLIGRGRPVTVMAHSMGGTVLTRAAQLAPSLVAHAVYLTAFMPASDVPAIAYAQMPENAGDLVLPSVRSDPALTGALRLDTGSAEEPYRQQLREAFYGDLDPDRADAAIALLSPDAPAGIALGSTMLTPDGWGALPRTYVSCSQDMAVRPALQKKMVADADAAFAANPTTVIEIESSHSPFLSMPDRVADIVAGVTGSD